MLLSLSLGLHWTVMQSVAWAGMLVTRTQSQSLSSALRTTFDGRHPCKLCKAVTSGKAAEKQAPGTSSIPKLDGLHAVAATPVFCAPVTEPLAVDTPALHARGPDSPVPPPPRA